MRVYKKLKQVQSHFSTLHFSRSGLNVSLLTFYLTACWYHRFNHFFFTLSHVTHHMQKMEIATAVFVRF